MKNICVIGTGYVGLVNATCFADLGNTVVTVDIDEKKIKDLQNGIMPIYEPGLAEIVARNVKAGRLDFTTSYAAGLQDAEFVFICVGTPQGVDGEADLQYVRAAAETIARTMDHYLIIINKSTVPVGTGDWVADIVRSNQPKPVKFSVVSCPEFLREGSAVLDFMQTDRTVLGSTDQMAAEAVAQLYLPLRAPIVMTDLRTAEMIKYASNAFLATRISFINEISIICEKLGADVTEVAQGMGFDKRIGHHYLQAGVGYGGSCFTGEEVVYTVDADNRIVPQSLTLLFESGGSPVQVEGVEVVFPKNSRVLAFDLETGESICAEASAFTRRPYRGDLITIEIDPQHSLQVTADHPIILYADGELVVIPAQEVRPGDQFLILTDAAVEKIGGASPTTSAPVKRTRNAPAPDYVIAPVQAVHYETVAMLVYSLETTTGTFIGNNNLVLHNCFPKDVSALAYMAQTHGMHPQLLHAVVEINAYQRKHIVLKLADMLGEIKGKIIGVLGLAFKENTDDVRDSPSLDIIRHLLGQGATVKAYDPVAMTTAARDVSGIVMCANPYDVAQDADALVIATPWNEFKQLDMERIRKSMQQPFLVDGRNMYDPDEMRACGFRYRGVGRGYNGDGV